MVPISSDRLNSEKHYEENSDYLVTVQATYQVNAPDERIAEEAILRDLRKGAIDLMTLEVSKR